jgi:hypothetical protein
VLSNDGSAHYQGLGSVTATDSGWTRMTGSVVLDYPDATSRVLYFAGPAGGVDIYLDDVVVSVY